MVEKPKIIHYNKNVHFQINNYISYLEIKGGKHHKKGKCSLKA
jgi:hypothetical protein